MGQPRLFVLLKHKFYRKYCRHWQDSNSDRRSRRQARWPLGHHHLPQFCFNLWWPCDSIKWGKIVSHGYSNLRIASSSSNLWVYYDRIWTVSRINQNKIKLLLIKKSWSILRSFRPLFSLIIPWTFKFEKSTPLS